MVIDFHAHVFAKGWVPNRFFEGIATLAAASMQKKGMDACATDIAKMMADSDGDPHGDELIKEMDGAGIDRTIVLPIDYGIGLGDAHYKKDPCTAQGISDTFCDAEYLAEAIDQGLRGERDLLQSLADYGKARVACAMPFFDLTCQMATLAPPAPEVLSIYTALQKNQNDTNAFLGTITGAISPEQFFAPENVKRILSA